MHTQVSEENRKKTILTEMLKAYYAVVFPNESFESICERTKSGGLVITMLAIQMIYEGKEAWGEAEEAAHAKMVELRGN